jgi:hypothetical protein
MGRRALGRRKEGGMRMSEQHIVEGRSCRTSARMVTYFERRTDEGTGDHI